MISERIQQLREEWGYTESELAKNLPIDYSIYAKYESDVKEPDPEILQVIAKFYNVSVYYIIGLTDKRKRVEDVYDITDTEYEHVCRYRRLDEHGRRVVDSVIQLENERASVD